MYVCVYMFVSLVVDIYVCMYVCMTAAADDPIDFKDPVVLKVRRSSAASDPPTTPWLVLLSSFTYVSGQSGEVLWP